MDTRQPNTACHSGMDTGRLYARMTPVTTADRSPMVDSLWQSRSKPHSKNTQAAAHTAVTSSARQPKITMAAIRAGHRAMSTSPMIFRVVAPESICGEAEITSFI